jgi:predicted hydrocarbon binding protein
MPKSTSDDARRLIVPAVPLAVLQAVRDSDRPGEVLEDEDLSVSLPRRLGLTGVFDTQIRRYEGARQWQRSVPYADLVNLMRLVLRRPDAGAILLDAGQRIARSRFQRVPDPAAAFTRFMPRAIVLKRLRRIVGRSFRAATGDDEVDVGRPLVVRVRQQELATLDEIGTACRLYAGLLEELAHLYTRRSQPVSHSACMSMAQPHCEWILVE